RGAERGPLQRGHRRARLPPRGSRLPGSRRGAGGRGHRGGGRLPGRGRGGAPASRHRSGSDGGGGCGGHRGGGRGRHGGGHAGAGAHPHIMGEMAARTFIVAEAGVNHNGDLSLARALVDAAAEAGADAVKFQTFTADGLVTRAAPTADYQRRAAGELSQHAMLAALELSPAAHEALWTHCAARGIEFLSTPFDVDSAHYLKRLGVRRLKISSGDVTNLPMLEVVGALGLPVILSTGMADLDEVDAAVA